MNFVIKEDQIKMRTKKIIYIGLMGVLGLVVGVMAVERKLRC